MEEAPEKSQEEHSSEYHNDVRTLLSWSAPGRPFRKKRKEFFLSGLLVVFLIEVILFVFSEFMLMFVVGALYFLAIALNIVPPKNFHYRISTEGIKIEDHFYLWGELYDFYFKHIDGSDILIVRTEAFFPGELRISMGDLPRDHVRRALIKYLPYREYVKSTFMERSGDWLSRNFPLEGR